MATKVASNGKKPRTKSEILNSVAEHSGLTRKQVGSVIEGLSELIGKDLGRRGPGAFSIPGLVKLKVVRKPKIMEWIQIKF